MKPHPNDPKGEAGSKKCPLHLLPTEPLREIAAAMKHGADKYGRCNWRQTKVLASVYHGAILRHLFAWADGEDDDPESGAPHLAHIAANAMILRDALKSGSLIDDRSASEVKAPEEPGSELPPGVPPLPPGTRYGGRLRDYEGPIFGYIFDKRIDRVWDRTQKKWWGMINDPTDSSADWHIAVPVTDALPEKEQDSSTAETAQLPPGVPPLPPGTRYGGRLRDYDGDVFGHRFSEGEDENWLPVPTLWSGMKNHPRSVSGVWHIAIPL